MGESRNMDAADRIREINAARKSIGESAFLGTDSDIKEAFQYDLCQELVLNDEYEAKLEERERIAAAERLEARREADNIAMRERLKADNERIKAERIAREEREEAERIAREEEFGLFLESCHSRPDFNEFNSQFDSVVDPGERFNLVRDEFILDQKCRALGF